MNKSEISLKNINREIKYLEKLRDKISTDNKTNIKKRSRHRNRHLRWQYLALKCPHLRGVNEYALVLYLATNFEFNKYRSCRSADLLMQTGQLNYLTKQQIKDFYSGDLSDLTILTEKDKVDFKKKYKKGSTISIDDAAKNINKHLRKLKDNGFIKIKEDKAHRESSKGTKINFCKLSFPSKIE
jgi:hypothetical protein